MKNIYTLIGIVVLLYNKINAQCPSANFTSTAPSCNTTTVNFTNTSGNTGGGWTYSWDFDYDGTGNPNPGTSVAQNPTNVNYDPVGVPTGIGVYTVVFTITNAGLGCSSTVSKQIDIRTVRANFASSANSICTNDSVRFYSTGTDSSGNATVTHSWSFGDGATPGSSNANNPPAVTYSSAGEKTITHYVSVAYGGGCGGTITDEETLTITVNASPVSSFNSTAPQCTNTAVDFTNSGSSDSGYTYSWDFGTDATPRYSASENPMGITYSSSGNKSVSLQITNPSGCSNTASQNITIDETPTVSFTSTAPKCTGLSVDFTNTGTSADVSWSWNFGAGAGPASSTDENPANVIYSTSGSKIVTLTITNTITSCAVMASQPIDITETPAVSFTSNAPQCTNTGINFSNTGASDATYTYNWDFGTDASPRNSTSENPTGVLYTSAGNKSVSLQITNTSGCSNTIIQPITISETPTVSFASTAPQCTGLPVDFTNTGTSSGVTWAWDFGSGATPATSNSQNPTNVVYSTAGSKIISFTITNTITNCAVTVSEPININQTPTASFTSNAPQCAGTNINFNNTGSTGGNWSYAWDFGTDALPKTSVSENPQAIKYSTGGNKVVSLTVYNTFCTQTSTQNISINSLPVANAGADTIICANTTVQLGSASVIGNTYNWFPSSTLNNGGASDPVAQPIAPVTKYVVTVTNGTTGCVNYDTVNVTMLEPLIANAGEDVVICRYENVQLGAALLQGQNYSWSPAAGLTSTVSSNPYASPDSTITYTLTVTGSILTSGAGCPPETDEVKVTVHQLPIANAGADDTITVGSSTQLVATGGLQYSWRPAYALSNIGINTPIANPETTTEYIVQVIDIYGCIKEDSVIITVIQPSVWVPSAFTPNGDGKSDVFIVRGEGVKDFEFGVFNRWGEQLFYSKDMHTGWDGTRTITGELLPAGAYVYYVKGIKTDGEVIDMKGIINLIR